MFIFVSSPSDILLPWNVCCSGIYSPTIIVDLWCLYIVRVEYSLPRLRNDKKWSRHLTPKGKFGRRNPPKMTIYSPTWHLPKIKVNLSKSKINTEMKAKWPSLCIHLKSAWFLDTCNGKFIQQTQQPPGKNKNHRHCSSHTRLKIWRRLCWRS